MSEDHLHCWHSSFMLTSLPAQHGDVCCFCGTTRTARYRPPRGHGPHLPASALSQFGELYYSYAPGVVPGVCPARKSTEVKDAQ